MPFSSTSTARGTLDAATTRAAVYSPGWVAVNVTLISQLRPGASVDFVQSTSVAVEVGGARAGDRRRPHREGNVARVLHP